jgi:hypothetical protein
MKLIATPHLGRVNAFHRNSETSCMKLFFHFLALAFLLVVLPVAAQTEKAAESGMSGSGRVSLKDVDINGEVNSEAIRFDQRSQFNLNDRVKLRSSFLDRVNENGRAYLLDSPAEESHP